jgi:hypothetical protein
MNPQPPVTRIRFMIMIPGLSRAYPIGSSNFGQGEIGPVMDRGDTPDSGQADFHFEACLP